MGMAGGPAWNAWVGTLVPQRIRARYFAGRSRVGQAGLMLGFAAGGAVLYLGSSFARPATLFAALFLGAALSRVASTWLLAGHSEPARPDSRVLTLRPRPLVSAIRRDANPRILVYLLAMQIAVHLSGPFFNPYMLHHLELGYRDYAVLIVAAYLGRVLFLPTLGRVAARRGADHLLWLAGLMIAPAPALWLLSDWFGYLLAIQVVAGAGWAAHDLAMMLLFIDTIPAPKRMAILTVWNLFNAAAMVFGSAVGGAMLGMLGTDRESYLLLFVLSSAVRAVALLLLVRWPAVRPQPALPARPLATAVLPLSQGGWRLSLSEAPARQGTPNLDRGVASSATSHAVVQFQERSAA
jgi:MFS family permease